jgi:hypothetical protein
VVKPARAARRVALIDRIQGMILDVGIAILVVAAEWRLGRTARRGPRHEGRETGARSTTRETPR